MSFVLNLYSYRAKLTGQVRHAFQLLLPVLRDGDLLVLLALSKSGHALLVGVVHHLSQVVSLQSVEYVHEVVARRSLPLSISIREI